jgi:uncharacterized protein (TIGR02391 family)
VIKYNVRLTVTRTGEDGTESTHEVKAIVGSDSIHLPITADVEEGDVVEERLPNGKIRRMRITKVAHFRSPFRNDSMDNIEAHWETAKSRPTPVTREVTVEGLHQRVSAVAGSLFASGHFSASVFEAMRAVEARIQALTGSTDIGTALMGNVFGNNPALDVAQTSGRTAEDERAGFRFLFMGAMAGIRNPRGHGGQTHDSQDEAIEYLALASMLMRRLHVADARRGSN